MVTLLTSNRDRAERAERLILSLHPRLYLPLWKRDGATFPSDDAYGHIATVTGALWTPRGRTFDGVNDLITIGAASDFAAIKGLGVIIWIRPDSLSVAQVVIEKGTAANRTAWEIVIRADGSADWNVFGETLCQFWSTASLNRWYMLTGIINPVGTRLDTYLNARHVTSQTVSSLTAVTGTVLQLGQRLVDIAPFKGAIGDVIYFDRLPASVEIAAIYQVTRWQYE